MTFPFTPVEMPGITVNHIPDWVSGESSKSEAHLAWFLDDADLNFAGQHAPWTHAKAGIYGECVYVYVESVWVCVCVYWVCILCVYCVCKGGLYGCIYI